MFGGCIHSCLVVWWWWAKHKFAQFCCDFSKKRWFALWPLLALDAVGVSTFYARFTQKADVPNLAVQIQWRVYIFSYVPLSAPISVGRMVERHLHCFLIDANGFTRLDNTQCFHPFRSQVRMTLAPSKVPKKNATIVANVSYLPAIKQTKKHTSATNAHQFRIKHAIYTVFCCGMGVATPKKNQAARTNKFVAVKGEKAKTSDACWKRSKVHSWPLGDGFWHLRIFCRIAAENPNVNIRFSAPIRFFEVFQKMRPKQGLFETKNDVPQNCCRMPQNCRRIQQPTPPKNAKLTPKEAFFTIRPKF